MVSKIAKPAVTEPPGLLMYKVMSASRFWLCRKSSWAITTLAT